MFKLKPRVKKVEYQSGMYFPNVEFQTMFDPDGGKWCVRINWQKSDIERVFLLWEREVVEYATQIVGEEKEVPTYIIANGHKIQYGTHIKLVPYYFDTELAAEAYIKKLKGEEPVDYNRALVETRAAIRRSVGRRVRGQKILGDTC